MHYSGNTMITGSEDRTCKQWDLASGKVVNTLIGHNKAVRCLQLEDSVVFTGSWDNIVRAFDLRTGKQTMKFDGHSNNVLCLQRDAYKLVSVR
jgi:WD40 repeat protein